MNNAKDTNRGLASAVGGIKRVRRSLVDDIELIGRDAGHDYYKVARSVPDFDEELLERGYDFELDDLF